MSVSKDMPILEALQLIPGAAEIFIKYGMSCVNCLGAVNESIERGAKAHEVDLNQFLKELDQLGLDSSDL